MNRVSSTPVEEEEGFSGKEGCDLGRTHSEFCTRFMRILVIMSAMTAASCEKNPTEHQNDSPEECVLRFPSLLGLDSITYDYLRHEILLLGEIKEGTTVERSFIQ